MSTVQRSCRHPQPSCGIIREVESGDTDHVADRDAEFAANAVQSMHDVFWAPEIERRGGVSVTGPIQRALVRRGVSS